MLKFHAVILLLLMAISAVAPTKLEVETGDKSSSASAIAQLQKIQDQAHRMEYGECWTKALKILQSGCRRLTDETQGRIAYAFMRCHLISSNRKIPDCPDEKPISDCTDAESLSDLAFSTYTEFFTHSQQICFHLQNQAWHEATESTIDRLADNSEEVASQLERSSSVAQEIANRQNISLENQELLLKNEEKLKISMQQSVLDVQKSHAETKQIIQEQRVLFSEVFDRVAVLQKTVLGEFSSIYTFGFYVGSTILAYILTSTSRTNSARVWVFFILILNAITERFIANYYISDINGDSDITASNLGTVIPDLLHARVWICRQIYCTIALLVLIISAYRFKDYNKINHTLLNEIIQQNRELQEFIKDNIPDTALAVATQKSSALVVKAESSIHDEVVGKRILLEKMQQSTEAFGLSHDETTAPASLDDTPVRPVMTTIDLTDNESDCTFQCSDIIDDSEASSVYSVSTTSSVSTVRRNGDAVRSLTPVGHSSPMDALNQSRASVSVRKTKRRSSVLAVLDDSIAYVEPPAESVFIGGYNLRRRRAGPDCGRAVMRSESVEQFTSYMLNGLAEQSASRRSKIRQHFADKEK